MAEPRAVEARVARSGGRWMLLVRLRDERVLALPLWLYPTLLEATAHERRSLELIAGGRGLRWPLLDLDLSVRGMLAGRPDVTQTARARASAMKLREYARAIAAIQPTRRAG